MIEQKKRGRPPNKPQDSSDLALLPEPRGPDILAARKRARHSQTAAAAVVGMSRWATWSDWERGIKPMPALAWTFYLLAVGQHPTAQLHHL